MFRERELMNLTERERTILQLSKQGLSDYKIARKMSVDPPNVTRSRKNAYRKLVGALSDIEWAAKIDVSISEPDLQGLHKEAASYEFFL
jgi:DNA-binding NarL/FixJ family response regulator